VFEMKDCKICGGTGWRSMEREGFRTVEICECRRPRRDEDWWLARARIPKRHQQCDFEQFHCLNESLQHAKIKARAFVEQYPLAKEGLLFLGRPGVGKTHLAIAILRELMLQKGADCLFCSYQDLLQRIRESYDPVSLNTELQVLRPVLNCDVVVIDDLGANRVSEWVEDTVTYILSSRYNEHKPTILTSNLPDGGEESREKTPGGKYRVSDTLTDRVGLRVRSRLYEMCDIVSIHADDFRQTVRAHSHNF